MPQSQQSYSDAPTPEEFGLDVSVYEDFKIQEKKLRDVLNENHAIIYSIENSGLIGLILLALVLVIPYFLYYLFDLLGFKSIATAFMVVYVLGGWLALGWFAIEKLGIYNVLTFGKYNKAKSVEQSAKQGIENLEKITKEKVGSFEKAFHDYYQEQLDNFYATKLYRKHSGTPDFEQSLGEFGLMLKTLASANKTLLTNHFWLGEYQDYFDKRKTDHIVQQAKIESEAFLPAADFVKRISQSRVKRVVAPEETYRTPRKINWENINKSRAKTGMKGEEIVVEVEQEFFRSISRDDLAEKVRHVSKEDGDGSGYDVLSFFPDGNEKYIEVKSTTGTLESPFYISRNELGFLQEHNKDAFVYRVRLSHDNDDVYLQSLTSSEVLLANEITPVQYLVKL